MTDVIKLSSGKAVGNQPVSPTTPERDAFWPTVSARSIQAAVEVCHQRGQLGLITGPSGAGKTTAVRRTVRELSQADGEREAVYLSMTRAADNLQPGLLRIAQAVRASVHQHMGAHELHDAIIASWRCVGSLVVLDEAQFMSDGLLHGVRNLWDELDALGRAPGIVLVGMTSLAERVEGRVSRKGREFEALRGRLGVSLSLDRLESDDFAAISGHIGLTGASAKNLLQAIGRGPGGLHNVRHLLAFAARFAGDSNEISFADLKQAAVAMGVSA